MRPRDLRYGKKKTKWSQISKTTTNNNNDEKYSVTLYITPEEGWRIHWLKHNVNTKNEVEFICPSNSFNKDFTTISEMEKKKSCSHKI